MTRAFPTRNSEGHGNWKLRAQTLRSYDWSGGRLTKVGSLGHHTCYLRMAADQRIVLLLLATHFSLERGDVRAVLLECCVSCCLQVWIEPRARVSGLGSSDKQEEPFVGRAKKSPPAIRDHLRPVSKSTD